MTTGCIAFDQLLFPAGLLSGTAIFEFEFDPKWMVLRGDLVYDRYNYLGYESVGFENLFI